MTAADWLSWTWTYAVPVALVTVLELLYLAPLRRRRAATVTAYGAALLGAAPLAWLHVRPPWDRVLMIALLSLMAAHALLLSVRGHRDGLELIAVAWEGAAARWALLFLPAAPRRILGFVVLALVALPVLPMVVRWSWRPPWNLLRRVACAGEPDTVRAERLVQRAGEFRAGGDRGAAAYCDYWATFPLRRIAGDGAQTIASLQRAAHDARAAGDEKLLRNVLTLWAAVLCKAERCDEARRPIAELQALERGMVLFLGQEKSQADVLARMCPP